MTTTNQEIIITSAKENFFLVQIKEDYIRFKIKETKTPFGYEKNYGKPLIKYQLTMYMSKYIQMVENEILRRFSELYPEITYREIRSGIRQNKPYPDLLTAHIYYANNKFKLEIENSEKNQGEVRTVTTIPKDELMTIEVRLNGLSLVDEILYFHYTLESVII